MDVSPPAEGAEGRSRGPWSLPTVPSSGAMLVVRHIIATLPPGLITWHTAYSTLHAVTLRDQRPACLLQTKILLQKSARYCVHRVHGRCGAGGVGRETGERLVSSERVGGWVAVAGRPRRE